MVTMVANHGLVAPEAGGTSRSLCDGAADNHLSTGESLPAGTTPSKEDLMRVGYFGYSVRSRQNDVKYLVDLRRFFRDFANSNDVAFKSRFRYGGEALLLQLLDEATNTYLFVQSRDLELVKRIQKRQLSADDLSNLLGASNSIGFASYVVIGKNWMSFACRVLSPRQTAFGNFVNELFQALNIPYDFTFRALQTELAANRVAQLDKVGRIKIEVNAASPLMQHVADFLTGGDGEEWVDAAELHVAIVPSRKKTATLGETLNEIVNRLPHDGLESIEARAKLDAADRMSDMYIYGAGAIRDYVVVEHEAQLPAALQAKRRANQQLIAKLEEYRNDDEFDTDTTASGLGISWARAYANRRDDD